MATYLELHGLSVNDELLKRINVAVALECEVIRTEGTGVTDHDRRLLWAKNAIRNVDGTARQLIWILLAQNSTYTLNQILNSSDTAIQTAVSNALEVML